MKVRWMPVRMKILKVKIALKFTPLLLMHDSFQLPTLVRSQKPYLLGAGRAMLNLTLTKLFLWFTLVQARRSAQLKLVVPTGMV
jgi:hypothetical protein